MSEEVKPDRDKGLCSLCDSYARYWYPAYDKVHAPEPYCEEHFEQARKTIQLEGVPFLKLAGYDEW